MYQPIQQLRAEFFKALAHPARIRILGLCCEGEQAVSALVAHVGLEASHLSQQLGIVRRANLVTTRQDGTSVWYQLVDRRLERLLALAKQILLTYLTQARDQLAEIES